MVDNEPTKRAEKPAERITRKVTIHKTVLSKIDQQASDINLSRGEYVERCFAEANNRDSDATMLRSMLIECAKTIEQYRRLLEYAGCDLNDINI